MQFFQDLLGITDLGDAVSFMQTSADLVALGVAARIARHHHIAHRLVHRFSPATEELIED